MKHKNKSYSDAKAIVNDVISNNKNIYSVQQCVLWTLTNYHDQRSDFTTNMNILYESLYAEAQNNGTYSGNGNYKPTITTTKAVVNNNGVIGPFSINGGPYTISAKSKVGNNTVGNSLYKDKNCTKSISSTDNYNGDFYVKLNNTSFDAGTKYNVTIDFTGNYLKTVNAKYWTTTNKNIDNSTYNPEGQGPQPLISFSKEATTYSKSFSGSYSKTKNGKYSLNIVKKSNSGAYLAGTTFSVNNKTYTSNALSTGISIVKDKAITNTTAETYEIKEITPTSGYKKGYDGVLQITVNKEEKDLEYKVTSYQVKIKPNGETTYSNYGKKTDSFSYNNINITFNSSTGTITVTYKNEEITGTYGVNVKKVNAKSNSAISGVKFKVKSSKLPNGEITTSATNASGLATIGSNIQITKDNVNLTDSYTISEIDLGNNTGIVKLKKAITISVSKGLDSTKTKYIATSAKFSNNNVASNNGSEITQPVELEDGTTADAKLKVYNGIVTITIPNAQVTGSYQMSFVKKSTKSTTGIDDVSDALPGAKFTVVEKFNGSTVGNSTTITTLEEKEKDIKVNINNINKDDVYEITEIEAPEGYLKSKVLNNCYIRLTVTKGEENSKYVVKSVFAEIVPIGFNDSVASTMLQKDKEFEFVDVEGIRLKFTSEKIIVELSDPPEEQFKFIVQKKSAEDNQEFLENTDMTIKRTVKAGSTVIGDAEKIIHNGTFEDGEAKFIHSEDEINTEYTYYYDIYENDAQSPYKNILGKNMFLRVTVNMDEMQVLSATLEVKGVNGYIPTQAEKDEVMNYVNEPVPNPDNRMISLIVKNPKETKSVNLQLFKHQLDNKNTPVKDAEYSVKEIDENGNKIKDLPNIKTDTVNKQIANIQEGKLGKSYYYEVIEEKVPANYTNKISGVRVKIEINAEGNVSSSITQIKQKDSDVWESYNNTFERYVSISNPDENNNVILYMANSVKFDFTLYKRNYATNTNLIDAAKFNGTTTFKIEQIKGGQTVEKFHGTLADAQTSFDELEASANSTYKYRITETYVSDDFYDTLVDIPIILNIRTDANGNVMDESYMGSNWYFEGEIGISENQKELMKNLVYLHVGANNQVSFYIANMPKNYYSLQLVKVDKNGNIVNSRNAKFEVGMETNNPDGEEINTEEKETKGGLLNITSESGTIIDPGYTHTYTIKETQAPAGYTKLEGTIQLEAGFTDEGKLLEENISLKYTNTEGTEETIDGLEFKYDDESKIPTIQVYIPNESEFFEFELVKEDLKGDKIEADELENGNIDGAHFNINRVNVRQVSNTSTNATASGFFEGEVINDVLKDGTVNDIVPAFTNLIYTYQINEISAKSDYFNILEGFLMNLTITTDDNAKISKVEYRMLDTKNPANNSIIVDQENGINEPTSRFKKIYGDLIILETNDTRDKVTIHIKNTYGYKVRLNKINTSGTPIEAYLEAYLDAYNEEQNNYNLGENRKCALNGTYNIPGTNETYTVTGETTHLSEEYIVAGKKQIWTIIERGAKIPYYNVFENRYIDVEVEMNEQYELVVNGYTIRNSETNEAVSQEELENLKQYIESIKFVMEGNVHVLNITLKNPAKYRLKLTKYEADGQTELHGAVLTVNGEEVISNGKSYYEVDNITDIGKTISFNIQEKSTVKNHINILEGERKYLQISANLLDDGQIILTNKSILEYNGQNPKPIITPSYSEVFNYIKITPGKDSDGVPVINVGILNPLIYEFEVNKVDTSPSENKNPLSNAKFEIYSPIVNEQNGIYKYAISKKGVTLIRNSGIIYGTTTEEGKVAFEEKNMQVGKAYEYKIKETDAPSNIYENIFNDYNIYVKVKIDTTNLLILENYENGKNYEIRKDDGTKAPDSYYEYVTVNVDNTGDKASIKIEVENPTKIKLKINKKIFGNEEINLANTKFEIVSEISGTKELTTDREGNIVIDETPVKEGIYEYIIREKDVPSKDIINILSDNYIKFRLYVAADGSIYTVKTEGQDNTYDLYKANDSKLELDNTNIDDYISIDTTGKIDNISTVEIKVLDPQKYNLTILKKDKDTNKPMNNITFDITVFEDGETDIEKEIKLKDANTMQEKNLTGLKTSNVNGQEGVISINDILFEKAGTYKLKLHETSPEGYIEIGDVEIHITIEVIDGKYEVTNIYYEDEFLDEENTRIIKEEGKDIINIQIALKNERIKGSYDLVINKTDLDGISLDGAEVKITVLRNNIESELYEANDDVNSKNVVIPTQSKIENGTLRISNIRIEEPETYTIKIEEITAPENYVKLEKPIEIRVTTKIEGEGINTRYVLDSANLVNENKLIQLAPSESELEVTIKNEQFDLALRKFITKIVTNEGQDNERVQDITNRVPEVDTQYLQNGTDTTAIYNHTKEPISLFANDTVIYTIRVYNEADIAGYAEEVTDHLPEYLEYVNDDFNSKYGWILDKNDTSLRTVRTNYLSREKDEEGNLIKAFNKETGEIDYKELQIKCKVKENTPVNIKLTNIAEISNYVGENGKIVTDRDSSAANVVLPTDSDLPGYKDDEISSGIEYIPGQQDDDDFEKVLIQEFDLALRKFITGIKTGVGTENEKKQEVTTRIPVFKIDENGNYVYEHTKEPVLVANQNVVEYTIRVYNEGTVNGYAKEIKDDIPEGLEFLPNDETNKEYRWIMLDQDGNRTDDVNKAKYITSDYLSKEQEKTPGENLLIAFDKESYESGNIKEPDYKEVKVAFKVTMPNTSDKIIINQAQISDDSDEGGNPITDRDSTPNEWKGEDDEDIEKIKVLYFDLALRKWVTQAIVTENGQTQITETGHKAEDDPEEVVKVDLKKSKLSNVIVKFRYSIRITNEGEIAGEAQEISDYIPQGLVFIPEDNPDWRQEEGKVVTEKLKGKTLQPGESAEVEILLTWVNSENNMGVMVNTAEISKDYNEYGSPDIDSTPNNKVPGEDDIDDAPVMLTIKTGSEIIMVVTLGLAVLTIIGSGVTMIKKNVLNKYFK